MEVRSNDMFCGDAKVYYYYSVIEQMSVASFVLRQAYFHMTKLQAVLYDNRRE